MSCRVHSLQAGEIRVYEYVYEYGENPGENTKTIPTYSYTYSYTRISSSSVLQGSYCLPFVLSRPARICRTIRGG
jgi:hypothetical protein